MNIFSHIFTFYTPLNETTRYNIKAVSLSKKLNHSYKLHIEPKKREK